MNIVDLNTHAALVPEVAALLTERFKGPSKPWPDQLSSLREVRESLGPGRVSLTARDGSAGAVGWIGAISQYSGQALELHPLVVARSSRRQGIGARLVRELEIAVGRLGATTLWLGTDESDGRTNLAGRDLYPNVADWIRRLENSSDHPFGFYRAVGLEVVGLLPDANGFGKPDILMARRVRSG